MNDLTFRRAADDDRGEPIRPGGSVEEVQRGVQPLVLQYLRIAKRWRWLLLGSITLSAIAGLVVTLLMTPQYTAAATIEIQRENDRILSVRGVEPEGSAVDVEFYQTQYGLLRSQSLAERVAADLRLHNSPEFFEMFGADVYAERLRENRTAAAVAGQSRERIRQAGIILLRNVNVAPERLSRLVDIEFSSPDPQLSARIVNSWTQHFVETTLARRFEATSHARTFLEARLGELRQRLEQSERALVAYASRERIINLPTTTPSPNGGGTSVVERPIVAEDLAALNQELNEAIGDRMQAQSRLQVAGGSTTEALANQAISSLRTRRAELAGERARMLAQFEPEYPPARAIADQIAELDRSIAREEGRVRNTLQSAYQAAAARETSLQERVRGLQGDLMNLRGRTIQYNIYQREVDTNRQLYDALLQRYKEIGVAGGVGVNNISVVDPAEVPLSPSSPRLIINLLVSLLLGGVIGAGMALALEQIDETISDPTDVEPMLGLPLLGTIPKAGTEDVVEELEDRKSSMVEAYLSAQTRLAFTTDHGIPRTLTVTSTRPGEGKTTTAYALAQLLARAGRKVIIVDADMRSPSLHHIFGVDNERGLSNYLAGSGDLAQLIRGGLPNGLALLSAGLTPPNAAELLTGDRVRLMIKELVKKFDHVILDVPPVMGLADTPLIASLVEGTIFVIESHETKSTMARVAVSRLRDANARVLGALLTKFESKRAHYGYGYDYGYGYGENAGKAS